MVYEIIRDSYKIENNIASSINLNENQECLQKSLNSILLEGTIDKLHNFYHFENLDSLRDFLKINESIFCILDQIKPILKDYFPSEKYVLRIITDPEYYDVNLLVIIKVDYSKESMEAILNKLENVNSKVRPLKRKYGLFNILIDVESI